MGTHLVTGGAGFVGSHLCERLLAQGHDVVAIDNLSTGRLPNLAGARGYGHQFTFYNMDVRTETLPSLMERHAPDVVTHLAGASGRWPRPDPVRAAAVNVGGLLSVLQAAARAGVGTPPKVVFASSAAVYGHARSIPTREAALGAARPLAGEPAAKKIAEDYLRYYRRSFGVDFVSVVLPNVYGPRQAPGDGVVSTFARQMLRGQRPVIEGDGADTRDFLFIDDAAHALALAGEHGSGATLNVGTGVETSVLELFRLLRRVTGFRGDPTFGPARKPAVRRSALDHEAATRDLGWKPWTHLEDGVRETVAYLRETEGG